jgi:hypothetical protein
MGVLNGEINYLQIDFIMALEDGTQAQVYSVDNMGNVVIVQSSPNSSSSTTTSLAEEAGSISGEESSRNLSLSPDNNYSLSIFGYVDVLMGDRL